MDSSPLKKKREFLVLRCFNCNRFSVNIKTKNGKWQCKLCNGKQSIIKVYGVSYKAKDCRILMNDIIKKEMTKEKAVNVPSKQVSPVKTRVTSTRAHQVPKSNETSKWEQFIPNSDKEDSETSDSEHNMDYSTLDPRETIRKLNKTRKKRPIDQSQQSTRQSLVKIIKTNNVSSKKPKKHIPSASLTMKRKKPSTSRSLLKPKSVSPQPKPQDNKWSSFIQEDDPASSSDDGEEFITQYD